MSPFVPVLLTAALYVAPLVDEDVLEPSVRNEVEHALRRAPGTERGGADGRLPFATNGLSATSLAIRLVSEQRPDGRWMSGTNDFTSAAVRVLNVLAPVEREE